MYASLRNIGIRLTNLDGLLLQESQVRKLLRPSERVHRNFMDYIYTENPFGKEDQRFIYHEHDFVSLQTYEESWIDELMHRLMGHCKKGLLQVNLNAPRVRKRYIRTLTDAM